MDKVDKYLNEEKTSMDILDKIEIETLIRETKEFLDDDELNEKAIEAAGWGKSSVEKFGETIGHSPNKHGFFDACVSRMKGKSGWDKEKANGFCARLIDTAKGTTKWRNEENYLGEAKSHKAIENRVKKLNAYIDRANKDDVLAIEPDSTWEEPYEFKPIQIKGNFIYFEWTEPYKKNKKNKERFNLNNEDHEDDIKYQLNWVLKALKKGYKEDGKTFGK